MSLFGKGRAPNSIVLGRAHQVPAEVHYSSGSDRWWYHGPLWVQETRPVQVGRLSPVLADPRNGPVIDQLRRKVPAEMVARSLSLPLAEVRRVEEALRHAREPHLLRIYGLANAPKESERVLVTVDQDLIHEAPMIPYTRTEKGARQLQWATMSAMGIVDAIFLFAMLSFLGAGPSLALGTAEAQQQLASLSLTFGELVSLPLAILLTYVLMARRTLVLDLEVQPLIEGLQDTHTEAVYLVNSEKSPASAYLARLLRLDADSLRTLTEQIARFESDAIANLQEQARSLRTELDAAKVLGAEAWSQSTDLRALGQDRGSSIHQDPTSLWVLLAAVAVVVGVAVWAAGASGV
ncbi:MAG: hypothetical protein ACREDE_07685 [Thermoplasmata archaeon]